MAGVLAVSRGALRRCLSRYYVNTYIRLNRAIAFTAGVLTVSPDDYLKLTPQDWKKKLTPEQYYVTRQRGTEPAFSGLYYNHYEDGVYQCVCCGSDLFSSTTKFDSGSGWPSFHSAVGGEEGSVETRQDNSHLMIRTEVLCRECKAHLGHVFPDGPKPTGLRYCINSVALKFVPKIT